jgi:N-acetylglutamate synthase-like GNAT family acetyltransferase
MLQDYFNLNKYEKILLLLIFNVSCAIDMKIRLAEKEDMAWVNEQYKEVNFIASDFDNEIIAIAEIDTIKAGLGRLVKIENNSFELGGMYVLEAYRKHKLATHIIEFLLEKIDKKSIVFCIPFQELTFFYKRFGFTEVADYTLVPTKVINKYNWCKKEYKQSVYLLYKQVN